MGEKQSEGRADTPRRIRGEIGDMDPGQGPKRAPLPESDPSLNNPDATPGTGMLPPIGEDGETNIQPSG